MHQKKIYRKIKIQLDRNQFTFIYCSKDICYQYPTFSKRISQHVVKHLIDAFLDIDMLRLTPLQLLLILLYLL